MGFSPRGQRLACVPNLQDGRPHRRGRREHMYNIYIMYTGTHLPHQPSNVTALTAQVYLRGIKVLCTMYSNYDLDGLNHESLE